MVHDRSRHIHIKVRQLNLALDKLQLKSKRAVVADTNIGPGNQHEEYADILEAELATWIPFLMNCDGEVPSELCWPTRFLAVKAEDGRSADASHNHDTMQISMRSEWLATM